MYDTALLEQGGIQVEDGPLKKPDGVPLGTASLKGAILLATIDPKAIQRQVELGNLQPEFQPAPMVAYSRPNESDIKELMELIGTTPALTYCKPCREFASRISPKVFIRICQSLGLDTRQARIFLVPETRYNDYLMVSRLLTRIVDWDKEPTEIGSFSYDGKLTIELLGPYKCMEAVNASNVEPRTGEVSIL